MASVVVAESPGVSPIAGSGVRASTCTGWRVPVFTSVGGDTPLAGMTNSGCAAT